MSRNLFRLRRRFTQYCMPWVNVCVAELPNLRANAILIGITLVQGIRVGAIWILWICFEGYTRSWRFLEPILEEITQVSPTNGHRAIFCLSVSLVIGQALMMRFTPFGLSLWSLLFWSAHGLVIHTYWDRGASWCRHRLGIQPVRRFDPDKPFDGLDLGN